MRADEAQVMLLDKMLEEIRLMKEEAQTTARIIKEQNPEGIVEPLAIVHVTTRRQVIHPPMHKPWFSVSLTNDGPDDCCVIVNTEKSSTTPYVVRVDETFEVDMGSARIDDLLVWCESGTASLRVRGVR